MRWHLFEQEAVNGEGQAVTLRYGEIGTNVADAPDYYEARIISVPSFARAILADGEFGGAAEIGAGTLILANGDGGLDHVPRLALDGRPWRLLLIEEGQAYAQAVVVLSGLAKMAVFAGSDGDEVHIELRDRSEEFDKAIQSRLLGGSNLDGEGLDGDADQEGDPLPFGYGPVRNAQPLCVNAALSIWCFNDTLCGGGLVPKVGGVPIPLGVQRASPAELALPANAPAAGTADWYPGAEDPEAGIFTPAYFRLGTAPQKDVTCDFLGTVRNGLYLTTTADIVRDIAVVRVGIPAGDLDGADFTLVSALRPAPLARYFGGDENAGDVMDIVARSVNAWWGFDRMARLRLQLVRPPAELAPVLTVRRFGLDQALGVDDGDALAISWESSDEPGWGAIPASGVKLAWGHNPTPQDSGDLYGSDVAGEPDPVGGPEAREWLKDEWRHAVWPADPAISAAIVARHRLALQIEGETCLAEAADAATEAAVRGVLHTVPREMPVVSFEISPAVAAALDLGVCLRIEIDRYGWQGGGNFLIRGLSYSTHDRVVEARLWG